MKKLKLLIHVLIASLIFSCVDKPATKGDIIGNYYLDITCNCTATDQEDKLTAKGDGDCAIIQLLPNENLIFLTQDKKNGTLHSATSSQLKWELSEKDGKPFLMVSEGGSKDYCTFTVEKNSGKYSLLPTGDCKGDFGEKGTKWIRTKIDLKH